MDNPPQEPDVKGAISQLSSGKALESDAILSGIYKAGGPTFIKKVTKLFQYFCGYGFKRCFNRSLFQ